MMGVNRVTLLGRAAAAPEVRQTKSGKTMVNLVIAIPGFRNGEGTVEYFDVAAWDATAEACAKFVTKGTPIYAEGRLNKRVWEGEGGQKRSKYSVAAQRIVFLGSKNANGEAPPAASSEAEQVDPLADLTAHEESEAESGP